MAGPDDQVALVFDAPVTRADLRRLVSAKQAVLTNAGLVRGGSAVLCLAPSLTFVTNLLACWRIGARAALLDHRLTSYEIHNALHRLAPQVVVTAEHASGGPLRGFQQVEERVTTYPGRPSGTAHALVQLSSGSTGPSKVIARTAANLVEELERYTKIGAGVPQTGERIVCLASMVHVLGLVGGLMYGLHAGAQVAIPARMTADGILATVAAGPEPTTLLGVPFHIELLSSVQTPPALPQLTGMTTGGELVRAEVHAGFVDRYGVRLGNMYGMTEVGVIATDLFGEHRPFLTPAPGLSVREEAGELLVSLAASPYLGLVDPARWSDGWLHTKDAGTVDPATGRFRIQGRRDSQVSVGGLKVDLTEVEHTLAALPGVAAAVVTHDKAIEAYVTLREDGTAAAVQAQLAERLAAYKRPRVLRVVEQLPRTATGKLVRDRALLVEAAEKSAAAQPAVVPAQRPAPDVTDGHHGAAGPAVPASVQEGSTSR
ncbi:fatty acid--CoA ligase family protein [Dactylosporangium fulvum]|uniref:Fatty acid--CoA ligase family protein n=1 Tax=Dactylosporangium fulvum TaxID=53359 RepID=A0ABY5WDC8_9ACTN|nr:fatty acid--CoA ligase family protein [Dactylosporangium fulvum]UWP87426.1 fatty acid--CoA ligase family protein [Dactylosporangium fulvum]